MTPERIAEIRASIRRELALAGCLENSDCKLTPCIGVRKVAAELDDLLAELERLGAECEALAEVADNCRQLTWDPGTGSLGINLEQNVRLKAALDALERIRGVD
jgi:hypothetical protein